MKQHHTNRARSDALNPNAPVLRVADGTIGYNTDGVFHAAVEGVSFEVVPGDRVMLIGPSGCGKSTILKAVAGFIALSRGEIEVDGRRRVKPGPDRAVVFQEFDQLFPWKTIEDNIIFPLRQNGRSKAVAKKSADEHLAMMGLSHAATKFPHQLSGGMKQRVAIARAFALQPQILLMDEPFASLDEQNRSKLQKELKRVLEENKATLLFVTHSVQEAVLLGTKVILLAGRPSNIAEVIDVSRIDDPESPEGIQVVTHLREALGETKREEVAS